MINIYPPERYPITTLMCCKFHLSFVLDELKGWSNVFWCHFQVAGGCWYVLAIQRVASCLQQQCQKNNNCDLMSIACSREACNRLSLPAGINEQSCMNNLASVGNQNLLSCLNVDGPFQYGIYDAALPVISSNSLVVKILYPIFWGLMTLRYFSFPRKKVR